MGLLKKLFGWNSPSPAIRGVTHSPARNNRVCGYEEMEPRLVLSADPVIAGITYWEGDSGQDNTPDHFEVSFQGGAETTQLTQFVINGDQDLSGGLSDGDMFFDVDASTPGTGGFAGFQIDAANSRGIAASDIRGVEVGPNGLTLTVNVDNFEAGDILVFTIDVDEVERFKQDKIASGVEFEGSFFTAQFVDKNYNFVDKSISVEAEIEGGFIQPQSEGIFYDDYDQLLAEGSRLAGADLDLKSDNATGHADRTAGAVDAYDLEPKPITISGNVFHDENLNCDRDGNESGIAGVEIELQKRNDTGVYETVATTRTDLRGHYEFGEDLGLLPGQYRLVESQPRGFLSVGADAGTVNGTESGFVQDDAEGHPNIISDIDIRQGDSHGIQYDFCEVRPASLSGTVWHDRNDDGAIDPGEEGIGGVLIRVTRIGAKDASIDDPFGGMDPIFVRTDAQGNYEVDMLPPGIYQVTEINNAASKSDPLNQYLDGKDSLGNVRGRATGTRSNDQFDQVELRADDQGVEYNFGELKPSVISGYVSITTPDGECVDPTSNDHRGIQGVEVQLYDESGELVATDRTDANGFYSFEELRPGVYSIVEVQPDQFIDAGEDVGRVDGIAVGTAANDQFTGIVLKSDQTGTMYNFCEQEPASVSGTVYHDRNDNGRQDPGEEGIGDTVVRLYDSDDNLVAQQRTDAAGNYEFTQLVPGTYKIREFQPDNYLDGKDRVGSVNGTSVGTRFNDRFTGVTLLGGQRGINYDFGELRPGSISGFVLADADGDCVLDRSAGDRPLANVTMELLNQDGDVIATTQTTATGFYQFSGLAPGQYSVRQVQPEGLFSQGQDIGRDMETRDVGTGNADTDNLIRNVSVGSGQQLVQYNFCEVEPAEIHGRVWEDGPAFQTEDGTVPADYRAQRDGTYQLGVDTPLEGVRMQLYYYIDLDAGLLQPRAVTLADVLADQYPHMAGADATTPIWVVTDANGEYSFTGLKPGSYIVLESQPEGYVDGNDRPGSTTGFTYNSTLEAQVAPQTVTRIFSTTQVMDSVVNIQVAGGGVSVENNFSEVRAEALPDDPKRPWWPPEQPPRVVGNPSTPTPGIAGLPGLSGSQPSQFTAFVGTSRTAAFQIQPVSQPYSWHLSVVNAGQPRSLTDNLVNSESIWQQASALLDSDWHRYDMEQVSWTFTTTQETGDIELLDRDMDFGMFEGIPLAGDFDGDGVDEVAVYRDGYWFIDINHNGTWDDADLLAKLGSTDDTPVVGDWDGDGKDDIGIYGPMWARDPLAIASEPGLPNPENAKLSDPKNVPPSDDEATDGIRIMRLTSHGRRRADLVDHVFGIGAERDVPVTGDWNGNGIRSIGVFNHGLWQLDVNGDGEFDSTDEFVTFGRSGDIPLVGDFDGDGIEDIAVYRSGTWIIDSNGNRELDATDRTFELGGAKDTPVVGDWNGDGIDEPAIYHARQSDIQL